MKSELKRRGFIEKISLSLIGLSLISFNPIKIFAKENKTSKMNVKINPLAVKRVNKNGRLK